MNKSEFAGWKSVFAFTYIQGVKAKVSLISMIIFLIVGIVAAPLIVHFNSEDDEENGQCEIETIYVEDNTDKRILEGFKQYLQDDEFFKGVEFEKAESDEHDFIVTIEYEQGLYNVKTVYNADKHSVMNADMATEAISEKLKYVIVSMYGLEENVLEIANASVDYEIEYGTDFNNDGDGDEMPEDNSMTSLGVLMIILIMITMGAEAVASSILTEKSSKVVEILMITIRPMGLVIGKILASLCIVFTQVSAVIVGFVASAVVTANMGDELVGFKIPDEIIEVLKVNVGTTEGMWYKVILIIIIVVLGFLVYSVIAAILGATVSKIDELAESLKVFTLLLLVCVYACMFTIMGNMGSSSVFANVLNVIPLTNVFITPLMILSGNVSMVYVVLGIVLQVVVSIILLRLAASIYEYLLYYNGEPLKLKELFALIKAKNTKKGGDK